jgi:putative hydrolase of the HAD superfamily
MAATGALKAVFFDAGLTLIESASPWRVVASDALRALGDRVPEEELDRAMTEALAQLESVWHSGDWWCSETEVRRLFVGAYERGLARHAAAGRPSSWAPGVAQAIYDAYQATRYWALFPDVVPTLRHLRARGVRMGVVSDWGHGLEAILLELGLGSYLEFLVVSSRLGVSKPDPRVFRMALDRVGAGPQETVYVGDTYLKDVLGARAAGITPILLDRHGAAPEVDCTRIQSLGDLVALVDGWAS